MNFKFQRHLRIIGAVVGIVGTCLVNVSLICFGWLLMILGYMATISKIETYIEEQSKPKKEDDDAIR